MTVQSGGSNKSVKLTTDKEAEGSLLVSPEAGIFVLEKANIRWRLAMVHDPYFDQNWKSVESAMYGSIAPMELVAAEVGIVTPSGDPTKVGAGGANVDNEAVFDDLTPKGEAAGTCLISCEGKAFPLLKKQTRVEVWKALDWQMPDVGSVKPKYEAVPGKPEAKEILYASMPPDPAAFGAKNLKLAFAARPQWAQSQDMELFFHRDGTGASAGGGANVVVGNPNWSVYWPKIAATFPGSGGNFGPQCSMQYDAANKGPDGQWASYAGKPGPVPPHVWVDMMTIYNMIEYSPARAYRSVQNKLSVIPRSCMKMVIAITTTAMGYIGMMIRLTLLLITSFFVMFFVAPTSKSAAARFATYAGFAGWLLFGFDSLETKML